MNLMSDNLPSTQGQGINEFRVGVEVGPAIIRAGIFDSQYRLHGKTKITTRVERGTTAIIERIIKCIRYAVDECDLSMAQISRIGIAVPGHINQNGVVESCPELRWQDVPLRVALAAQFDAQVEVGQVHELGALGIRSLEFDKPVPRFAAIFLAPQIGAAISIDDEWQDLSALHDSDAEADALGRNILATIPHPQFAHYRGRDFRKALRKPEKVDVWNYVTQIAETAGLCAARIHRHYSPEVIALGGGLIDEMKEEILAVVQASFERAAQGAIGTLPPLLPSRLGDLAPITGAAIWANGKGEPSTAFMASSSR